ncbi:MAG: DUF551 domain-containing protein [Pseudomonadota bacterium]|nr:DUF551 domain-containing protein [Pseudomonadota bacterium]
MTLSPSDLRLRLALHGAVCLWVTRDERGDVLSVEEVPPERLALAENGLDDKDATIAGGLLIHCDKQGQLPALVLSLVAMARRAPRWIWVEERLPEEGQRVLVWPGTDDRRAFIATRQRFAGCLIWMLDGRGVFSPDPAFWQPLPDPPEGV